MNLVHLENENENENDKFHEVLDNDKSDNVVEEMVEIE
jgi:hypothetical protein